MHLLDMRKGVCWLVTALLALAIAALCVPALAFADADDGADEGTTEYTYKITFVDTFGGETKVLYESDPVTSEESSHSFEITVPTPVCDDSGYQFNGWRTAPDGGGKAVGDIYTATTEDTVLYADWVKKSYTIIYHKNPMMVKVAWTMQGSYSATTTVGEGIEDSDGLVFYAWCDEETGLLYQPGDEITLTSDITHLYGLWIEPWTCTVEYDANGGEFAEGEYVNEYNKDDAYEYFDMDAPEFPSGATSVDNATYEITIGNMVPKREGYTFLGWSSSSTNLVPTYTPGSTMSITAIDVRVYLTAVWAKTAANEDAGVSVSTYGTTADLVVVNTSTAAQGSEAKAAEKGETVLSSFEVTGELNANETLTLAFDVGKQYAGWTATVYVHHSSDGTDEVLEGLTVAADGTVTVSVKKLSTFTVAVKEQVDEPAAEEPSVDEPTADAEKAPAADAEKAPTAAAGDANAAPATDAAAPADKAPEAAAGKNDAAATAAPVAAPAVKADAAAATSPQTGVSLAAVAGLTAMAALAAAGVAVVLRRRVRS